jgi:hypothetical protein
VLVYTPSTEIDAAAEQVWDMLTDFARANLHHEDDSP